MSGRIAPAALSIALAFAFLGGCAGERDEPLEQTVAGIAADGPPPGRVSPPAALAVIGEMQGPESALHDPEQDVYFISNINGGELARDGNGFISRVDPETFGVTVKWIESGRNGAYLDGPKGMTIVGDTLYVSDVTAVRMFDRRSGAPRGSVPIPGATFLNDLTNDGRNVYVSDTGLTMGPGLVFLRTGTDAIWKIAGGRATKIAGGADLKQPNGVDFVDGHLRVVSFGANELYDLTDDGRTTNVTRLPGGELDGIVHLGDGSILISSWKGNAIYRGGRGGPFEPILLALDAPADIGYDGKRNRLLIPRSFLNQVTVHPLE